MRTATLATVAGVLTLLGSSGSSAVLAAADDMQSKVQAVALGMGSAEIRQLVKGKVCTTEQGARFTFTRDGHYTYEGLWKNNGHYSIGNGAVLVLLDNGLERSFAISRRGETLYMEKTVVSCN